MYATNDRFREMEASRRVAEMARDLGIGSEKSCDATDSAATHPRHSLLFSG